tara:strand:+ start:509 stop:670 length:162 start_codon:yes stop_codon:yes gene_type:complete
LNNLLKLLNFIFDLFSSVVFFLISVGSSFFSPVEGSNLNNLFDVLVYVLSNCA